MSQLLPVLLIFAGCIVIVLVLFGITKLVKHILEKRRERTSKKYEVKEYRKCSGALTNKKVELDPDLDPKLKTYGLHNLAD